MLGLLLLILVASPASALPTVQLTGDVGGRISYDFCWHVSGGQGFSSDGCGVGMGRPGETDTLDSLPADSYYASFRGQAVFNDCGDVDCLGSRFLFSHPPICEDPECLWGQPFERTVPFTMTGFQSGYDADGVLVWAVNLVGHGRFTMWGDGLGDAVYRYAFAVPEPGTVTLLLPALGLFLWRAHRHGSI